MNQAINLNCTPLSETVGEIAFIMVNGNQMNVLPCEFLRNDFVTPQIRRVDKGLQYYITGRFDLDKAWEDGINQWAKNYDSYVYETGDENSANAGLKLTDWIQLSDQKLIDALNNKAFTYELFMDRAKEVQAEAVEKLKAFADQNGFIPYQEG